MITGSVNTKYETVIRLQVFDAVGKPNNVDAILDTGFNGWLTLPTSVIAVLGLPWRSRLNAILGNGSVVQFDVHTANVIWDGSPLPILVYASDTTPLLGTALLINHDLRIRMVPGGRVEIEPLP